jgi:hypothetical protein
MLRTSPLFQFRKGNHACVFYRSEDTLLDLLTSYVAEGLQRGERCFCAQKPETLKRLVANLNSLGVHANKEIKRGALQLCTEEEAYFPSGKFEPAAMIDMLIQSIDESQKLGFAAFRSAGELSWAVRGWNECDRVVAYEKIVEETYPKRPAIGLCQYPINAFPTHVLQSILETHQMHLDEKEEGNPHSSLYVNYETNGVEVVADRSATDPRYYYVVQDLQRPEPTGWGIAADFDSAMSRANQLARETRAEAAHL